jgi:hexosaminidase
MKAVLRPECGIDDGRSKPVSSPRIAIEWECLSNLGQEQAFSARLLLRNVGDAAIKPGWSVYFNTCRKLDPASVSAGYVVEHVNGDLFRLCEPGAPAWLPGQAHDIAYNGAPWAIGIADAPLGFFLVTAPGMRPVDLGDPVVAPFEREEQLQRHGGDAAPVMDAARRYADNAALTLLESEQVGRLTPRPASARWLPGALTLGPASQVGHAPELAAEADLLRAWLAGLPAASGSAAVTLETGPLEFVGAAPSEAYRLEAGAGGVTIRGGAHGVFNALQTLRQLAGAGSVPYCVVEDAPRFAYRGQMLDVARHFVGKGAIMRLLDCMARYKLNRFHFHLTDDEGWRLAIAALPELTEVGARRGVPAGTPCLPPSFGSGADVEASAGTGYYTRADFIEILRYAHARHIEVIPEFNLPGHARAAVVAMQVRAARLRAARDPDPERHLLSDPGDVSVYESVQLWRDNVICIARPSVDRFLDTVVGEVVAMYREAGAPLRAVHTGGDEVPAGAWRGSPLCRARMVEHGWTSVEQLHEDFLDRCRTVLARHGLAFAGWEETALTSRKEDGRERRLPNPRFAGPDFVAYAWNNAWGSGHEDSAYRLANAGYPVVLANASSLYFDLAYAKDPEEPGYYWAGFVETRDAFTLSPLDLTATPGLDAMGRPVPPETLAAMAPLDAQGRLRIAGLQGQLWGENARTAARIEYFVLPRMLALAERAWSPDPGWSGIADPAARAAQVARDWNEFANRLGQRELPRLDAGPAPFGYRLPPPGVRVADGRVHANVALPGLALHYTFDGGAPSADSPRYAGPVAPPADAAQCRIATFDTRGRASRIVTLTLKEPADA